MKNTTNYHVNNNKSFTRLCKRYHTFFEGFQVPVGATYGRCRIIGEEYFWVCDDYHVHNGNVHIHYMKRSWLINKQRYVACMQWYTMPISNQHKIYKQIQCVLREFGGIPKVTQYQHPNTTQRAEKRAYNKAANIACGRKKAQSDFQYRCRPQGGDNADMSHPIHNYNSYWSIGKDVVRY